MSLGFAIAGRYPVSGIFTKGPSPAEWLRKLHEWLEGAEGTELVGSHVVEGPDGDVLLVQLHPFAEALQVTCPRLGEIAVMAATGPCGPGYHEHACRLLQRLTDDMKVQWLPPDGEHRDDAGFFVSGDRAALQGSALRWLADEIAAAKEAGGPFLLGMPADTTFLHEAPALTLLGPRDAAWLERAARADAVASDAFPWWSPGRDADYFRRRALGLMWTDIRWRAALHDGEEAAQAEVLRCLAAARDGGATDLPWREWSELLEIAGDESGLAGEIAARAKAATGPLVGYRRGDVVARLPGDFRVRLPGSFSEELDDDGTWHGSDGARSIYVSVAQAPPAADGPGDAVRLLARTAFDGESFEHRGERVAARAGLRRDTDDDGTELWVLACGIASGSLLVRVTLTFEDDADRDWALATFKSFDRGEPRPGSGPAGGLSGITSIG